MATAKAKTAAPAPKAGRPKTIETFNRLPHRVTGIVRQVDLNPASIAKVFEVASNSPRPLTVQQLSIQTLIPRGTINAILEATPEGKKLVEGNLIALKRGPGFDPAWVAHSKNPKKIPIPGAGVKGGEVVLWENKALPAKIRDTAIIKDFNGQMELIDALAASSSRSPKFVVPTRAAIIERAIDAAEKRQAAAAHIGELEERQVEMKDHFGLVRSRSEEFQARAAELEEEVRVLRLAEEARELKARAAAAETAGA